MISIASWPILSNPKFMTSIQHPSQPTPPGIQNRQQLDAVVENIIHLQQNRAELERDQEREITAVRQKYRTPLAEVDRYLLLETTWVETWARANPEVFSEKRSMTCTHAVIGYRVSPPRIDRASRKWTWSEISQKLSELAWGRRYLRQPAPEVNKEALLADRLELVSTELRKVGIKIVQDERFFITPHGPTESAVASETDWQEAA
jgi:phage host-nuclease inhibitor protein Gam